VRAAEVRPFPREAGEAFAVVEDLRARPVLAGEVVLVAMVPMVFPGTRPASDSARSACGAGCRLTR